MHFYIYSRKSIYTGKGESIENQIELCRSYISSKYPSDPDPHIKIYEDEGFSGKNTERPQFQKMLCDIQLDPPDFIVCYRLDRISRSVSDFSTFIEKLNRLGISFLCIKEEFDTSRPMGKAMMYIASVFSQLERETIAERVRDNMLLLARSGRWLGGTLPTGYTSKKICEILLDGKVKTACTLQEIPEELDVIHSIYQHFLQTHQTAEVASWLQNRGQLTRSGKNFSPASVRHILQNPVYCIADADAFSYFTERDADLCFSPDSCSGQGLLAYNKRNYRQKGAPRQTEKHWIIAAGRHRGIICGRDWVTTQHLLSDRHRAPGNPDAPKGLLCSMLYCRYCGSPMVSKRRSKNTEHPTYDYICSKKLRHGTALCSCQNLNGPQTDEDILLTLCSTLQKLLNVNTPLDLDKLSQHKKRIFLTSFVKKIQWDGTTLQLFLFF